MADNETSNVQLIECNTENNTSNCTSKVMEMNDQGDKDENSLKNGKQGKQLFIDNCNESKESTSKNKHDNRVKARRRRDLSGMSEDQILNSRLRSSSGKLYSSSVSVEAGSAPNSPVRNLTAVVEDRNQEESDQESVLSDMCPKDECCKGTSKLITMIQNLQQSVDGAMKKMTTQEILQSNTGYRVQDLQERCDKYDEELDEMDKELQDTKFQLQLVSKIVVKQDQQISFLKQKITEIQQREMAANIVIAGIPEKKQEDTLQIYNRFVQKGLEIQELIPANKAYRIGAGNNRPLLVELRHAENKKKLFSAASKLKGKQNEKGGSYFLSEHLPEEMNETRRRANELFSDNRRKQASHQLDMNFVRGKLVINEEPYLKSIHAPTAAEILKPDEALFDRAQELDIVKGAFNTVSGSKFTSYAVAVESFEDIQAAYMKLRMKFADATHISCAFRLPGSNTPQNQDYVDDGEFGCGRTILKALKEAQLLNMAVFIVRYYGGKHLGTKRYELFQELSKVALKNIMEKRQQEASQGPPIESVPDNLIQPPVPRDFGLSITEDWSIDQDEANKKTD